MTGCDQQTLWRISCAGAYPTEQDLLHWRTGAFWVFPLSMVLWRLLGGVSMWSEAVYGVHWFWSPPRSATACVLPRPPSMSYKAICSWLLLVLGLAVPRQGQAVYQGRWLLVPGLGPLSKRYGARWGQMLLVWDILQKSDLWAKTSYTKGTGNKLGGPTSLMGWGLRESPGWVNSDSQADGDSNVVPACYLCGVESSSKEQWPLPALLSGSKLPRSHQGLTLMPDLLLQTSVTSCVSLVPFKLLSQHWSSGRVILRWFIHGPFKRNCLGLQKPSVTFNLNFHWLLQP